MKYFEDKKLKFFATKCWPLKPSSFKVIISSIGKNSSTRNFVSVSTIGSSVHVASSSKKLGLFLFFFQQKKLEVRTQEQR